MIRLSRFLQYLTQPLRYTNTLTARFINLVLNNGAKKKEVEAILQKEKEKFEGSDYYKEMALKYGKPK